MENASKALIIAGAILLSILIIGLGMFIYTQASNAMGKANLDSEKAQAYNAEFLQYNGTISGSNARALYSNIENHNRVNFDDPSQQIVLVINDTAATSVTPVTTPVETPDTNATMSANTLRAGNTYYVYFQYNRSGYITQCTITKLKNQ